MSGLKEFEAAIFDKGNIASAELNLEEVAVMRGTEQDCLPAQRDTVLAVSLQRMGLCDSASVQLAMADAWAASGDFADP